MRIKADNGNRIGSGIIIASEDTETYILTAYHNIAVDVANEVTHVEVELDTEEKLRARISRKRMDTLNDIAVLIIENPPRPLQPISWGSSTTLKTTQRVYAIGHPRVLNWSVTDGTVMGLSGGRIYFSGYAVQERNSGGPLLNEYGTLVGMVVHKEGQGIALTEEFIRSSIRGWVSRLPEAVIVPPKGGKDVNVGATVKEPSKECRYVQSAANYSNCTFPEYSYFLSQINPEGFNFTNSSGIPEWIKRGLDEYGRYSQKKLIKEIKNGFVNLKGAYLSGAILEGLILDNADLSMANIQGGSLRGSSLKGANIKDANFSNAIWTDGKPCKIGSVGKCLQ